MADKTQITEIKRLARQGESVNEIKDKLDLAKSTVYYHFKKEVGQKQKENQVKIPEDEEVKGEICGIFAGDGYFKEYENGHYTTVLTLNYKQNYWKRLSSFLEDNLDKEAHFIRQDSRARLKYDSKKLYKMLKTYLAWKEDKTASIELKNGELSRDFKKGFLRGLIDTDGNLNNERYIFNTISGNLKQSITDLLKDLEMDYSLRIDEDKRENCRDMHRVILTQKSSKKFQAEIRPRHPKKEL